MVVVKLIFRAVLFILLISCMRLGFSSKDGSVTDPDVIIIENDKDIEISDAGVGKSDADVERIDADVIVDVESSEVDASVDVELSDADVSSDGDRSVFDADDSERDSGDSDSDGQPIMSWGEYAASLDVPSCPPGGELIVNTTETQMVANSDISDPAEAGPELSFVEAVHIAFNRAGPDSIVFDPTVFPVNAPATIDLSDAGFPINTSELCIDGRDRGVILFWDSPSGFSPTEIVHPGEGSLFVGLTLLGTPYEIQMYHAQVAACRINTDGFLSYEHGRFWSVNIESSSTFGPGNVVAGYLGVRFIGNESIIEGNYFGYDPLTERVLDLGSALDTYSAFSVIVRENVFAVRPFADLPYELTLEIEGNYFGTNRQGQILSNTQEAGLEFVRGTITVGPDNIFRGLLAAVTVGEAATVRITRNSISGNAQGIVFEGTPPVEPPTLISVSSIHVAGQCSVDGVVEIFSDLGDQGEQFLGSIDCFALGDWYWEGAVPTDRNVTATLTDNVGRTSTFSSLER